MQLVLFAGLSAVAAVALAAAGAPARAAVSATAPPDTGLAARIAGTWAGHRTGSDSKAPAPLKLTWRATADSGLQGTMSVRQQPTVPIKVVWTSDTAFIFESAPHLNPAMHEEVVTRSVVHFKGDSLRGTFDARPTAYTGKTSTGSFELGRVNHS
jgi:hypothetical protein